MTATINESGTGATTGAVGRIARITGPVIDAEFQPMRCRKFTTRSRYN